MRFFVIVVSVLSFIISSVAMPLPMPMALAFKRLATAANNVVCDNSTGPLVFHDVNVAQLAICGSIAGTIEKCEGTPTSTTGVSGTAKFAITPVNAGDTINVSKGRWEQSIKLAFAQCGEDVPFTATFTGGATNGDINVALTRNT